MKYDADWLPLKGDRVKLDSWSSKEWRVLSVDPSGLLIKRKNAYERMPPHLVYFSRPCPWYLFWQK